MFTGPEYYFTNKTTIFIRKTFLCKLFQFVFSHLCLNMGMEQFAPWYGRVHFDTQQNWIAKLKCNIWTSIFLLKAIHSEELFFNWKTQTRLPDLLCYEVTGPGSGVKFRPWGRLLVISIISRQCCNNEIFMGSIHLFILWWDGIDWNLHVKLLLYHPGQL